jgi:GxxExxY protein
MIKDPIFQLCDEIRETSFALHRFLKHGHAEKVYENGLAHRLRKAGFEVEQQYPLPVYDEDGTLLGDFYADLYINQTLIVELKACRGIVDDHIAQLLGYLRAARIEHGLLINFGSPILSIKKYVLSPTSEDLDSLTLQQ